MEKLLTAEELAERTGLEVHAVHRYAREGKIPSINIGVKRRFPESALQRWIQDQLAGVTPAQIQPVAQSAAA